MKTELKNISAWGRLHYDFLYRNNRTVINVMRLNGTLNNYLAMCSEQSENRLKKNETHLFLGIIIYHPFDFIFHPSKRSYI